MYRCNAVWNFEGMTMLAIEMLVNNTAFALFRNNYDFCQISKVNHMWCTS